MQTEWSINDVSTFVSQNRVYVRTLENRVRSQKLNV